MELKLLQQAEWEVATHQLDYTGGSVYRESLPVCEAQARLTLKQVVHLLGQWETIGRNKRLAHYEKVIEELRQEASRE